MALPVLALISISVFIVSIISVFAVFILRFSEEKLFWIVSFAAGSLLSAAFLDLLPEAVKESGSAFMFALIGVVSFFILERFLHWHHHHASHRHKEKIHSLVYMVLVGDGIHNFIDGTVITASFMANLQLGIATTIAIVLHEIPQELGDAGILIYSGMSRLKAAFFNFLSALTAFLGAYFAYFFSSRIEGLIGFLIGFAAGGFIYVAAGDLLPELRREIDLKKSAVQLGMFMLGIIVIWAVRG